MDPAQFLFKKTNRHYKFTDLIEDRLRWLNSKGLQLAGNPKSTEKWIKIILAFSWISLWPSWLLGKWTLKNYWFISRKPENRGL